MGRWEPTVTLILALKICSIQTPALSSQYLEPLGIWAYKIYAGHPLPLSCELCACSLHNSVNLLPTIRMLQKGMKNQSKYFGEQETPDPLVINKFNRSLLNGVFKDLECKFWLYSKGYSALSWDAWRFLGVSNFVVELWWSAKLCTVFQNLEMQMDEQGT